jgi:branched-chain amino acid transport system ATP-binding protein
VTGTRTAGTRAAGARATGAALSARGLRKRFGAVTVLDGVDLDVGAGEVVGVVGPNGAGKTTLLDLLGGALPAGGGTVRIGGDDAAAGSADRCRQGLGRTHQVPRPFTGMTVFENVLVGALARGGRPAGAYGPALAALERTGMAALANRPAAGLGLLDRKRLELARALATGPRVLLLDEVAGGLTDAETDELVVLVRRLAGEGIGVVWIEHIVHVLVRAVDRLVCLAGGSVVADGDPHEVIRHPAVVRAYFGGTVD